MHESVFTFGLRYRRCMVNAWSMSTKCEITCVRKISIDILTQVSYERSNYKDAYRPLPLFVINALALSKEVIYVSG